MENKGTEGEEEEMKRREGWEGLAPTLVPLVTQTLLRRLAPIV